MVEGDLEEDVEKPRALGAKEAVREEVEKILRGDLDRVDVWDVLRVERERELVEAERRELLRARRSAGGPSQAQFLRMSAFSSS